MPAVLTLPSFTQGSVLLCFPFGLFKRLSWWTLTQGVPRVHTSSIRILSTLWRQWNLLFTIFMSINCTHDSLCTTETQRNKRLFKGGFKTIPSIATNFSEQSLCKELVIPVSRVAPGLYDDSLYFACWNHRRAFVWTTFTSLNTAGTANHWHKTNKEAR